MNIVDTVKDLVKSNRVRKNYEKLEATIRRKATLASQLEFHRAMGEFYTMRVLETDPNTDWWGFAHAKQKQYDHQNDVLLYENRIAEADAEVSAQKRAYDTSKREYNAFQVETPSDN